MSSRIGKKTCCSSEYAARQLAYCKVPLLKVERPLKFWMNKLHQAMPTLPADASTDLINQHIRTFRKASRLPRIYARTGNPLLQYLAMVQA